MKTYLECFLNEIKILNKFSLPDKTCKKQISKELFTISSKVFSELLWNAIIIFNVLSKLNHIILHIDEKLLKLFLSLSFNNSLISLDPRDILILNYILLKIFLIIQLDSIKNYSDKNNNYKIINAKSIYKFSEK